MSISFSARLTADGDGVATATIGRAGFDGFITLIHVKPLNTVNVASKGAATLVGGSGRTITSDVDISAAATLVQIGGEVGHFTISSEERLTIAVSGADENNQFQITVHAVPIRI